jgi:hypothetical protein
LPPPNPLEPILPQPRLLSAFEAQPPGPQAPEWPLMPLKAFDLPPLPLSSCAQELENEE